MVGKELRVILSPASEKYLTIRFTILAKSQTEENGKEDCTALVQNIVPIWEKIGELNLDSLSTVLPRPSPDGVSFKINIEDKIGRPRLMKFKENPTMYPIQIGLKDDLLKFILDESKNAEIRKMIAYF